MLAKYFNYGGMLLKTYDYNIFLSTIKATKNIEDKDKRKETLKAIVTRLITDYGLNDDKAKYLIKMCE